MPESRANEADLERCQEILHRVTTITQKANAAEADTVELRRILYELRYFLETELVV